MSKRQPLTAAEIYLTKQTCILLPAAGDQDSAIVAATFNKNIESLGFTLSEESFNRLKTLPVDQIGLASDQILPSLKRKVGAHRKYDPMYPNFPQQVADMHWFTMYLNAIVHYWNATAELTALPEYSKVERPSLEEPGSLREIRLGSEADFEAIFTDLMGANSSMSETDKETVQWFIDNRRDDIERMLPESIPQKETLALLVGGLLKDGEAGFLTGFVKTPTDVLRVMVVLSGGDVSLAAPTKFKPSPSKKMRRFFLQCLEGVGGGTEDMLRRPEVWKRVGEQLHPGQYRSRFPKAYEAFEVIRKDKPFSTFESKVEAALLKKDIAEALLLLLGRPGVFARRLDHVLRVAGGMSPRVVDGFLGVASQVSTPVLMSVYNHFGNRSVETTSRTFFPKGNVGKLQVVEGYLAPLSQSDLSTLQSGIMKALVDRFRSLPRLGKVYIDDRLSNHPIPFARRSASKALRTLSRGTKMPIPAGDTLRFFIWWKNGDDRVDIDLSAVLFADTWSRVEQISYFNRRNTHLACFHSGDITTAPKGAAEFIDLDIPKMIKSGIRFVTMCVNSFSGQAYCDLPECFGGWMTRKEPQSGEIFEPKTVQDKMDLAADTQFAIPLIFDLEERVAVWADVAIKSGAFANVHTQRDNIARLSQAMMSLKKPNLYDLFFLHAEARGEMVSSKEEAEVIFSEHEGITPWNPDMILAEYLK